MKNWIKERMEFSEKFQQENEVKNPYVFNPSTDRVVWRNPTPLPRINYQGDDTAKYIWSSKTHRSASEAFRDADYATALWRCETEWDRTKNYLGWIVLWGAVFGALYLMAVWAQKVLP
jgi:hypothetical protein